MDIEKLQKLAELKEKGVLSEEEFAAAKEKLLNEPAPADGEIVRVKVVDIDSGKKSRFVTILLCIFLGLFGIHRFYTNSPFIGLFYLLTGGVLGFGVIYDLILLVFGCYKTGNGTVV